MKNTLNDRLLKIIRELKKFIFKKILRNIKKKKIISHLYIYAGSIENFT